MSPNVRHLIISLTILCISVPAFAQTTPADEPARQPRLRTPQAGEQNGARRGPRGRGEGIKVLAERLAAELELTGDQRVQFDAITAEMEAKIAATRENAAEMRAVIAELREARQAGDDARVEELRAVLEGMRQEAGDPRQEFFDAIEPILTEEQVSKLGAISQRMEQAGPMRQMLGGRVLARLKEDLALSPEQETQFDDMANAARDKAREAFAAGDREAGVQAIQGFLDELAPILTEEQRTTLAEARERFAQGPGGGFGPGPGERPMDVRTLMRATKRLELTDDQKTKLSKIEEEAKAASNEVGRERTAQDALAREVKSQIVAMLDAQQQKELDALLSRGGRGGPMRESRIRSADRDSKSRSAEPNTP